MQRRYSERKWKPQWSEEFQILVKQSIISSCHIFRVNLRMAVKWEREKSGAVEAVLIVVPAIVAQKKRGLLQREIEREGELVDSLSMMAFFKSLTLLLLLAIVQGKTNHESSAILLLISTVFSLILILFFLTWPSSGCEDIQIDNKCLHWSTSSEIPWYVTNLKYLKKGSNSWQGQIWTSSAESSILGVF